MAEDTQTQLDRIIEYVLTLDNTIEEDDYLNLIVSEVVDRAVIYMNRGQLIDETTGETGFPVDLERSIARVVVNVYHNSRDILGTTDNKAVKSVSDNGQTVSYGEDARDYLIGSSDVEVFSTIVPLLDKFRIPTIVGYPE